MSMEKPTECRWCGAEVRTTEQDTVIFRCGSWHSETEPEHQHQWIRCHLNVAEKRIQRAVETLKKAKRYTVTPGPRNTLDWDTDPDGSVTDSAAVDEALAILEGGEG